MDALSEDLRALVVAKELTLKQAIELNKQKAPVEEGLDKIVNLFDDDAEFERFTQSVQSDVVALRGGVQWENGRSALVSPGPKRRPGNKSKYSAAERTTETYGNYCIPSAIPRQK